jgi:ribosomal protein L37E
MAEEYGPSPLLWLWRVWRRESQDTPDRWAEYQRLHAACPRCGCAAVTETCIGVVGPPPDRVNHATCSRCGWAGVVDDLIPGPQPE